MQGLLRPIPPSPFHSLSLSLSLSLSHSLILSLSHSYSFTRKRLFESIGALRGNTRFLRFPIENRVFLSSSPSSFERRKEGDCVGKVRLRVEEKRREVGRNCFRMSLLGPAFTPFERGERERKGGWKEFSEFWFWEKERERKSNEKGRLIPFAEHELILPYLQLFEIDDGLFNLYVNSPDRVTRFDFQDYILRMHRGKSVLVQFELITINCLINI